jgi:tetratricopeptide (TPR) repeat protein
MISFFSLWTYQRNLLWGNTLSFWQDAALKTPEKSRVLMNYGVSLVENNRLDEGLYYYRKALAMERFSSRPVYVLYPTLYYNIASALNLQGKRKEAEEYFLRTLEVNPHHQQTHFAYGKLLERQRRYNEAILHYKEAIRISPQDIEAQQRLEILMRKLKRSN